MVNQYGDETGLLSQIIVAAREGIMHPSFMTPQEVVATLKSIE